MKIYTKTGDKGETSLVGGQRIIKNSPRIEAYGTIDELNSALGLIRSHSTNPNIKEFIFVVQKKLFSIGGELASPNEEKAKIIPNRVNLEDISFLEEKIDFMQEKLPPLKDFIIPGEEKVSAFCHVSRTICRRAERCIITLSQESEVRGEILKYVNRLSDCLFVLSRFVCEECEEHKWHEQANYEL